MNKIEDQIKEIEDQIKKLLPEGYNVTQISFNEDKVSGTIKFKKVLPVIERINSVEDLFEDHGITRDDFEQLMFGRDEDEVAFAVLKMVEKSFNEGWKADWTIGSQYKYFPEFYIFNDMDFQFSEVLHSCLTLPMGRRFVYKNSELAEHAAKTFLPYYKTFIL